MDEATYLAVVPPRYRPFRELGRGRSGIVYAARDLLSGDVVAVKITPTEIATAALARRLLTPCAGCVRIRAVSTDRGALAVIVMDRVEGEPFVRALRGEPALDTRPLLFGQPLSDAGQSVFAPLSAPGVARTREALRSVARALVALHERALVHGDIQPDNVLLRDEDATLVDIDGVAEGEIYRPVLATATYMSPEQARQELRYASDAYGLGVMAFEALTGAVPFSGSAEEVLVKKETVRAARPSFLVQGIPGDLDEAVEGLLERSPARRLGPRELLRLLRPRRADDGL